MLLKRNQSCRRYHNHCNSPEEYTSPHSPLWPTVGLTTSFNVNDRSFNIGTLNSSKKWPRGTSENLTEKVR